MHSIDQATLEDSCGTKKNASFHYMTRSVPGMKGLLPLKLLSPPLSEPNISPALNNRSTFGMSDFKTNSDGRVTLSREHFADIEESETRPVRHRLKPHRDIPIYTEPGSPLLSLAYLTDEELPSSCTASESDEWFEVNECAAVEAAASGCNFELPEPQVVECEVVEDLEDTSDQSESQSLSINRCSDMSFQCAGEPDSLVVDEAAWLRSPLRYHHLKNISKLPRETEDSLFERNVKSWLSDTSSCVGDNEGVLSLSHATALAPAKAHVVDVGFKTPSRLSIRVPPRSSSLAGTTIVPSISNENRGSWLYSSYSPPPTPQQWAGVRTSSPKQTLFRRRFQASKASLDLAIPSPPDSPTSTHKDLFFTTPSVWKPPKGTYASQPTHNPAPSDPILPAETINNILTSLETLTSHFPTTTLMPDTPCILAIRNHLSPSASIFHPKNPPTQHLPGLFPNPAPPPPDIIRRRKTTNFSKPRPRRSPSTSTSKSCPGAHFNPPQTPVLHQEYFHPAPDQNQNHNHQDQDSSSGPESRRLPHPDLQPLQRIFPTSSKYMRSSLYAYVIAHIFVSSLLPSPSHPHLHSNHHSSTENENGNGNESMHRKRRRDTPYWPGTAVPGNAADVLGLGGGLGIAMFEGDGERDRDREGRVERLGERLRRSIGRLVEGMGMEGEAGMMFIRCLEEVVRGCEVGCWDVPF